ncbi:DUF4288 domain-containing protein [Microbulbifer sp. VTAC004]
MWKTFAVKTLYRTKTTGVPLSTSEGYSDQYDMVEERVVTFKARSFDEAIERAEREAEEYAREVFVNPFGQNVAWYFTGDSVAFEPYDSVPANIEVFSSTYLVPRKLNDKYLADNCFGQSYEDDEKIRINFLNSDIVGFR